jgi:hypothetical protein
MKTGATIALTILASLACGTVPVQTLHAQVKPPVYYVAQNDLTRAEERKQRAEDRKLRAEERKRKAEERKWKAEERRRKAEERKSKAEERKQKQEVK